MLVFYTVPYAYMLDPGTVLPKKTAKHVFQHSLPVTFLGAQMIKALPEMQETRVRSLGRKDPLEKEMATHSSIPAWGNPMDRRAWQATVHEAAKS